MGMIIYIYRKGYTDLPDSLSSHQAEGVPNSPFAGVLFQSSVCVEWEQHVQAFRRACAKLELLSSYPTAG